MGHQPRAQLLVLAKAKSYSASSLASRLLVHVGGAVACFLLRVLMDILFGLWGYGTDHQNVESRVERSTQQTKGVLRRGRPLPLQVLQVSTSGPD